MEIALQLASTCRNDPEDPSLFLPGDPGCLLFFFQELTSHSGLLGFL
jgi:hypothetical protein